VATLPSVSGERTVRAFQRAGCVKDRQHGSHVILVKPGHHASLSVPQHRKIAPGTVVGQIDPPPQVLRSLIRASGISVAEFVDLL